MMICRPEAQPGAHVREANMGLFAGITTPF